MVIITSVAMDALLQALAMAGLAFSLAYLGTPSSTHLWPPEAEAAAKQRWDDRPWYTMLGGFASNRDSLGLDAKVAPGAAGRRVHADLMVLQGPNYALAKTAQQWRHQLTPD